MNAFGKKGDGRRISRCLDGYSGYFLSGNVCSQTLIRGKYFCNVGVNWVIQPRSFHCFCLQIRHVKMCGLVEVAKWYKC